MAQVKKDHCVKCLMPRRDSIKFFGNVCNVCHKKRTRIYNHRFNYKVNNNPSAIKKRKTIYVIQEEIITDIKNNLKNRSNKKKRVDREIYCNNLTWSRDNYYHFNFDNIMYCPMEHLTIEYWIEQERILEESIENASAKNERITMDKTTRRYLKKDEVYGRKEDGSINFYPYY